jgi:hypothetical protein
MIDKSPTVSVSSCVGKATNASVLRKSGYFILSLGCTEISITPIEIAALVPDSMKSSLQGSV